MARTMTKEEIEADTKATQEAIESVDKKVHFDFETETDKAFDRLNTVIQKADDNNSKALQIAKSLDILLVEENETVDPAGLLDVIIDYLEKNDKIFDGVI